jgi:hypothetical protein
MTILKGDKVIIESLSHFRNYLDVTWTEIAESMEEGVQEEMLAEVEANADEWGIEDTDSLDEIPQQVIVDMVHQESLNRTIIDVLEARDEDYIHIYDGTVHTIVSVGS